MSLTKRRLEEREELEQLALSILCDAGALEECDYHSDTYYDGGGDVEDAYKIANARISANEIDLPDDMSRRDFSDIIKSVYENHSGPDGCPACNNIFNKDD
jgi:hypothetical protein